jgi:hypothetical protein
MNLMLLCIVGGLIGEDLRFDNRMFVNHFHAYPVRRLGIYWSAWRGEGFSGVFGENRR